MRSKLLPILSTLLMGLGLVLTGSGTAQAASPPGGPVPVTEFRPASDITGTNTITNSGLSKRTLFVCSGSYPVNYCATMPPNTYAYQHSGWNPNHVWVPQYQCIIWRASKGNYASTWYQECGGQTGRWWDLAAVQAYMGAPINVDVINNDPR